MCRRITKSRGMKICDLCMATRILTIVVCRVVKKNVFFISCFFREKNMFFSCFFRFFRFFFLASDFFIFKDLTYNYCKLMMLFKTETFLFD